MKLKWILVIAGAIFAVTILLAIIFSYQNTITPSGIIIHHSAIPSPNDYKVIDAPLIEASHKRKGYGIFYWGKTYHIGYHYLILPDGTLQQGRPETCQGAHTSGHNDKIGICLIGEFTAQSQTNNPFEPHTPTPEQLATLTKLSEEILAKYDLNKSDIFTHHQFNPATDCPGENFLFEEFLRKLND